MEKPYLFASTETVLGVSVRALALSVAAGAFKERTLGAEGAGLREALAHHRLRQRRPPDASVPELKVAPSV